LVSEWAQYLGKNRGHVVGWRGRWASIVGGEEGKGDHKAPNRKIKKTIMDNPTKNRGSAQRRLTKNRKDTGRKNPRP